MREREKVEKAIKHFECIRDGAIVVLDSGFGMLTGENDCVYKNGKMCAEQAIDALEKEIPKKPQEVMLAYGKGYECENCGSELSVNEFNGIYCHWCGQKLDW